MQVIHDNTDSELIGQLSHSPHSGRVMSSPRRSCSTGGSGQSGAFAEAGHKTRHTCGCACVGGVGVRACVCGRGVCVCVEGVCMCVWGV